MQEHVPHLCTFSDFLATANPGLGTKPTEASSDAMQPVVTTAGFGHSTEPTEADSAIKQSAATSEEFLYLAQAPLETAHCKQPCELAPLLQDIQRPACLDAIDLRHTNLWMSTW